MVPNQYRLIFLRDNNDTIYGFKYYKYVSSSATYNYNQTYYYEFNLQGDVIAIYNASGNLYATYKYDAWGKLLGVYDASGASITSSTNIAIMNPIRYRGYIYDTETGFYYLQSRYYDPEVGRFLNLDAYINANGDFIGFNMYAYCNNNPVAYCDSTGEVMKRQDGNTLGGGSPAAAYEMIVASTITIGAIGTIGVISTVDVGTAVATPTIDWPFSDSQTETSEKEGTEDKVIDKAGDSVKRDDDYGPTYYHVTTLERAMIICTEGYMRGSPFEAYYVYAWKYRPSKRAIKYSGLGSKAEVIISFQTKASFVKDTGIRDPRASMFQPVVSARPGPLKVKNPQIVGVIK